MVQSVCSVCAVDVDSPGWMLQGQFVDIRAWDRLSLHYNFPSCTTPPPPPPTPTPTPKPTPTIIINHNQQHELLHEQCERNSRPWRRGEGSGSCPALGDSGEPGVGPLAL